MRGAGGRRPSGYLERADRDGCGWPVALEIAAGEDWTSGYYDICLIDAAGMRKPIHFVVVKAATPRAKAAVVLATNTYHAYNHWGGANAYCDVAALMERRADLPTAMQGAIGVLSTRRPFPQMLIAPPSDVPRLVNLRPRDFEERSWASDRLWSRRRELSPYDSAAGFLHKWEHRFVEWAEAEGLALDYLTDADLDDPGDALAGYAVVIVVPATASTGRPGSGTGSRRSWIAADASRSSRATPRSGRCGSRTRGRPSSATSGRASRPTRSPRKTPGLERTSGPTPRSGDRKLRSPASASCSAVITGWGSAWPAETPATRSHDEHHWALEGSTFSTATSSATGLPLLGYENDGCRFAFADDGRLYARRNAGRAGQPGDHHRHGYWPLSARKRDAAIRRSSRRKTSTSSAARSSPTRARRRAGACCTATPLWPRSGAGPARCSTAARPSGRMAHASTTPSSSASPATC